MTKESLWFNCYIGATSTVIAWLKKEGVKTRKQAYAKLREPAIDIANNIILHGGGNFRDKGAGFVNVIQAVVREFKK